MGVSIRYDDRLMLVSANERRAVEKRLAVADRSLSSLQRSGTQGFLDLPFDRADMAEVKKLARGVRDRFSHMVVVGIGGSDLGARTIWHALGGRNMRLSFLSNPDPDSVSSALREIDWNQTAINVISKSGTTLETMAIFAVLRASLIRAVGRRNHGAHVFVTTEPTEDSGLYVIAKTEGYAVVPHPLNVGGRFSVLSPVGLFPAAVAGLDTNAMLDGAKEIEMDRRKRKEKGLSARIAINQFVSMTTHGRIIHVVMPYADALSEFCQWYRQLWAESLGKRLPETGRCTGPTPVAARGAIDQHSQIQLYNDGPDDKTVTFIETERFRSTVRVPADWKSNPAIGYAAGLDFGRILHAERAGTEHALRRNGRPTSTIFLPSISERSLGALFMTYELAAAYFGILLGVNPFDQPGVEEGKRETERLLSA